KIRVVNLIRGILFISLLVAFAPASKADTPFLGPIPVQYATADRDVVLDMHRFFHPAGTTLGVRKNTDIDTAIDAVSLQLRVRPKRVGLIDVELSTKGGKDTRNSVLTLAIAPGDRGGHRFIYKPQGDQKPQKVYVAGVFNGWSADKTPLTGPNENGEFVSDVPLEP